MKLSDHQFKFTKDIIRLIEFIISLNYKVTCGEFYRPLEMQEIYMKYGKTKTLNSNHRMKCAADLFILKSGEMVTDFDLLLPIVNYWEELDDLNRSGADWNKNDKKDESFYDSVHFERNIL